MNKIIILLIIVLSLSSCLGINPMSLSVAERTFQYDYKIPGVSKIELFTRARNKIVLIFDHPKSVLRVTDKEEGKIIGRGLVGWQSWLLGTYCYSFFELKFKAKDEKARLQLKIIRGASSQCAVFPLPNESGYQIIKRRFIDISEGIKKALEQKSIVDDF